MGDLSRVLSACPTLWKPYHVPVLYFTNGHISTGWSTLLRFSGQLTYVRELLEAPPSPAFPDRGTFSVDYGPPPSESLPTTPVVIVVPGIAGSSSQHYVRNCVIRMVSEGWRCVVLNHRGCGETELSNHHLFTVGDPDDLHHLVKHMASQFPDAPILMVGFSMGGNVLVNYLGTPSLCHPNVVGAISFCQGYDLRRGIQQISPFYSNFLLKKLKYVIQRHRVRFSSVIDVSQVMLTKTPSEFDQAFTLKVHSHRGWKDPEEYYNAMSSIRNLESVRVPLLLVNSLDDPLIPENLIPFGIEEKNPFVGMAVCKYGGHLGFPKGMVLPLRSSLMDDVISEFFQALLGPNSQSPVQSESMISSEMYHLREDRRGNVNSKEDQFTQMSSNGNGINAAIESKEEEGVLSTTAYTSSSSSFSSTTPQSAALSIPSSSSPSSSSSTSSSSSSSTSFSSSFAKSAVLSTSSSSPIPSPSHSPFSSSSYFSLAFLRSSLSRSKTKPSKEEV